ncbi:MAG: phosphorylase [Cyclobacteriaceae bacterium]|nr:MAG: phosphorylase [Cyclobacteriaceae bacterium]
MENNVIPESELVLNEDGSVYHLKLKPENVASNVILVGDPGRVQQVAAFFDSIDFSTANREFVTVTGFYQGTRFTVISTGIGTDNIDIVMNELDATVNIDLESRSPYQQRKSLNIVRIGTSGGLHPDLAVDSFVLSYYGLGFDGLIYYYKHKLTDDELIINSKLNKHLNWDTNLATPYIVAADEHLLNILGDGMQQGITATATGFYGPQGRKLTLALQNPQMHDQLRSFEYQGLRITNFEMETSALYGLGKLMGHRCCTVCAIIANRVTKQYSQDYHLVIDRLISTVLQRISKHDG